MPVEILGLRQCRAGDIFDTVEDERLARNTNQRQIKKKEKSFSKQARLAWMICSSR